jgi:hypothetical protein
VQDIVIGWLIVPGFVGSLVAALWNHFARKELSALESRLRKQEETYRLAQSPRVLTAIDLWSAVCEYERSLAALVSPIKWIPVPPEHAGKELDSISESHSRRQRSAEREAWAALGVARDKAELLLPAPVLRSFDALFTEYGRAHENQKWLNLPGLTEESRIATREERNARLREAENRRPEALGSLQGLLGREHSRV